MKTFKYIFIFLVMLGFTACEDYFGENANVDPDNPTVATANVILPQVMARMAYTWGGDLTRYVGINSQHVDGVGRQFAVIGNYGIQPGDCDQMWANIYSGTLNSNRQMIDLARENGFGHYEGIGILVETFTIMMATDAWGDVPYSDAFKFAENGVYSPTFDTQSDIYDAIFANLASARTLLAGSNGGNAPGGDDLFYGGDIDSWVNFSYVLEARAHIHLSKVNGNQAYTDALAALGNGSFASSANDFAFQYGVPANENAPWFQYIEQRDDCETGAFYTSLLSSLNDPRLATYGFEHIVPGHPVFTQDQLDRLLSYTEQEFIRAEALLGTGDSDGAYEAYERAIQSSIAESGAVDNDDYFGQSSVGVGAGNLTMENIMTQKYIALYTSPEVFNDWRRTGIPNLSPVNGTQIPRRLPYAESEQFSNPDNTPSPSQITIFDRVWWDQ